VAVVGGTGPFGSALAKRLVEQGDDVVVGSRDAERAAAVAAEIGARGATNVEAVQGVDLVVIACDAKAALDTAKSLKDAIATTPVLTVASELRVKGERSIAERIADELDAPVAAGLHTVAARSIGHAQDTIVCGDDERTKELALELAGRAVEGRALDGGPLANARALEGLTGVIVSINKRYRAHAGVRVTGLE
jgi:NADPH-dependent F420 reductase